MNQVPRNPRSLPAPTKFLSGLVLLAALSTAPTYADYPLASHRYIADPAVLIHGGRVYLYGSNDDDNTTDDNYIMQSLICISSSDMKNWTDHGEVFRVPRDASWASHSWAPFVIERNGFIYLYFANNASGIRVARGTSPIGPFTDPRGSSLINGSTPGASGTNMWLFDPSAFIDDDGQAYLYFGGNGENNGRVIRLNNDMISVNGSATAIFLNNFFEALWMHKYNNLYYLSYSTNTAAGLRIDYMTSSNPMTGFTYRGIVAGQPPSNNNNNHAGIFLFGGNWYHVYHNRYQAMLVGDPPVYSRNLALERLNYNGDGTIQQVTYTTDGVPQLANLNPYVRVEGETHNAQSGIETETCSEGGMNLSLLTNGDWVRLRNVDFGAGASSFSARVASAGGSGNIELRLGSPTGTLIGTCAVASTGGWQTWTTVNCPVSGATGVQNLYLRFTGGATLFNVNYWQFSSGGPTATFTRTPTRTNTPIPGASCLVDDMEDLNTTGLWGGTWGTYAGASSTVNLAVVAGGAPGSTNGSVSVSGNMGDYAGVTAPLGSGGATNVSNYIGVAFMVRGNGGTYWFQVPNNAVTTGDHYGNTFTAPAAWTPVTVFFSAVTQRGWGAGQPFDLTQVTNLQWGGSANGTLDFQIDDIRLLGAFCPGGPPTSTPTRTATRTNTAIPPTSTRTNSPTLTRTATPSSTLTRTNTAIPPTFTASRTATPSSTSTSTRTNTAIPPTFTATRTSTSTSTYTAVPPTSTSTRHRTPPFPPLPREPRPPLPPIRLFRRPQLPLGRRPPQRPGPPRPLPPIQRSRRPPLPPGRTRQCPRRPP